MKDNKTLIRVIISSIIGIMLGIITELSLIFYWKDLAVITQDIAFWLLVYLIGTLFSKNIRQAIITNSLVMTFMSLAYYGTRIIYSGKWNMHTILYWVIFGILGAIIISTVLKLPKKAKGISIVVYGCCIMFFVKYYILERLERRTMVTNYVKTFNYNTYIILAVFGICICIISIVKRLKEDS